MRFTPQRVTKSLKPLAVQFEHDAGAGLDRPVFLWADQLSPDTTCQLVAGKTRSSSEVRKSTIITCSALFYWCNMLVVVQVEFHPKFAAQYAALAELVAESDEYLDLFGDVTALITALEESGHLVEEDNHHQDAISHPIVTSKYRSFALRRTPPTTVTPYASSPPVLRIPYVWFTDTETNADIAVVMFMGDKSALGNDWYPSAVQRIDDASMVSDWHRTHPTHQPHIRRTR